ncbi:MAG: M20/M25/M40 family metallo-hydrolase [Bacteroidales bacterium]
MKRFFSVFCIAFLLVPCLLNAQEEKADLAMIYRIKQEGFKNSDIEELSYYMTDLAGPRLTASRMKKRADTLARDKMIEYGLKNVRIEETRPFERGGWDNTRTYVAMTEPYYAQLTAVPKAWTAGTGGPVEGEAVLLEINRLEDLEAYSGRLKGKVVVIPSDDTYEVSYEPMARRLTEEDLEARAQASYRARGNYRMRDFEAYRQRMELQLALASFLKKEGVLALLTASGEFNVPRSSGANHTWGKEPPLTELLMPIEHHGRIVRFLRHEVPVKLEIDVRNEFTENLHVTNVIGEIPGTDRKLKDQVVLLGAHWDSWHGGTGAADNASGCIVMMEAMRILQNLGIQPRRTIRIALWGGEEQGLHGSRGYVEKYIRDTAGTLLPGYEQFTLYLNMDNGTGKFRGIYLQENDMLRPVFEAWLEPFADMGCSTVTLRNTSGTDHLSFDALGLPAFQFIQDPIEYGRGYHTLMDTYERLLMDDLRHNAVIVAALAYHAAMRDEQLPGKPLPEETEGRRGF